MSRLIMMMVFVAVLAIPVQANDLAQEAESLSSDGAALLQENHHDSSVATKEGLERGIELVRRSVELGYPDVRTSYLLLAEALNTLAYTYYSEEAEKFKDLTNLQRQYYRRLLELYPENAEVLYENAFLFEDEVVQTVLLRRAVEADPDHAESSFYLGMQLIQDGDFKNGVPLATRGVENCGALMLQSFGQDLLQALRSAGRNSEAKEFDKRFKELLREGLWIPGKPGEE